MVITQILGGLGNQMFQYAAGKALATRLNTHLKLDISGFSSYQLRAYELGCFNFSPEFASQQEVESYTTLLGFHRYFVPEWFRPISARLTGKRFLKEVGDNFNPYILKVNGDVYLHGYRLSEKYFKNIESIIRQDFTFKNKPNNINQKILHQMKNEQAVSVHVRRGDYVTDPKTFALYKKGICEPDYYYQARELIRNRIPHPHFYVFSDDPTWCKNHLKLSSDSIYVDWNKGDKGYEDLRLMSACKHHIIANSTFSWWGAWLNPRPDKIVISPGKWFNDSGRNIQDLLPASWIKILGVVSILINSCLSISDQFLAII